MKNNNNMQNILHSIEFYKKTEYKNKVDFPDLIEIPLDKGKQNLLNIVDKHIEFFCKIYDKDAEWDKLLGVLNIANIYSVECTIVRSDIKSNLSDITMLIRNVKDSNIYLSYGDNQSSNKILLQDFIKLCKLTENKEESSRHYSKYIINSFDNISELRLNNIKDDSHNLSVVIMNIKLNK